MKIFLDDIKSKPWLVNSLSQKEWGRKLLELKKGFYFVFDYDLNESDSSLSIYSSKILFEINEGIYRGMRGQHMGYVKEPFDTSSYLFYSLLLSGLHGLDDNTEKLKDMFLEYKAKDMAEAKRNLKQSIKGSLEINSSISFSSALSKVFSINQAPISGLVMLYDLINQYTLRKFQKTIYGEYLFKIVRAVKSPNGGLLPEYQGSIMRYLIIGEVAAKNDPSLEEAKKLYREGNTAKSVYLETGWYLNKFDNKWRKRISDDSFFFNMEKVVSVSELGQDAVIGLPDGMGLDEFKEISLDLIKGKISVAAAALKGFSPKLSDFVSYEHAFELYPDMKEITFLLASNLFKGVDDCHYDDSFPKSLFLVRSTNLEKIKYVALHELQHYVQKVEGFANGGNTSLAKLVDAVGGESVRTFFISLNAFQKRFSDVATLIPLEKYVELVTQIRNIKFTEYELRYENRMIPVRAYIEEIFKGILSNTSSHEKVATSSNSIAYLILTIYSMIPETNKIVSEFIKEYVGTEYLDFFKLSLEQNRKSLERERDMISRGWTVNDLYILNFVSYQSTAGEVESRFTQQTSRIPQELKNYFEMYTSETIDSEKVSVISDEVLFSDKSYEAALETNNGRYIIHLPESFSNSINLLHETGHILFDFEQDMVNSDSQALENAIMMDKSVEEYFCASFVDYVHRKNIDPMLTNDLDGDREILTLDYFDSLFDKMLYSEQIVDEKGLYERLDFVLKLM